MIFKTDLFDAQWDTWVYYLDGKYYLYYLITEYSPGEGFGVAVSDDGIHYKDHGIQISHSEKMVEYLGTGSVWKSLNKDYKFIGNFSEWREHPDDIKQQIFLSYSDDLIHWNKFPESYSLEMDERYYETNSKKNARWDCINACEVDGIYYGTWTARPIESAGIGMGKSVDGVKWEILPPPKMDISAFRGTEVESGGITCYNGKFYMMIGTYNLPEGSIIMTSDNIEGPYKMQEKNGAIFANQEKMHAYFPRFFDTPDGTFVNFHVLLREPNKHGRAITYVSPIKKVEYDADGTMRFKWWSNNDALKGEATSNLTKEAFVEFTAMVGESITLSLANKKEYKINIDGNCHVDMKLDGELKAEVSRDLLLSDTAKMKLLIREHMIEFYINDYFILAHTLENDIFDINGSKDIKYYALQL